MSDFECVCDVYEGEPCEYWSERFVIAAKQHKCCECHEAIEPGDLYQLTVFKFEGEFGQDRTCLFCFDERERLIESHRFTYSPPHGELACWLVAELRGDL